MVLAAMRGKLPTSFEAVPRGIEEVGTAKAPHDECKTCGHDGDECTWRGQQQHGPSLSPPQSNPTDADIINRITDQVQKNYGVRPKPGNLPNPAEVRLTKQIVILGNQVVTLGDQFARLEKIVANSKPASPVKAGYSFVYWIAGGIVLLAVLFVGFLLFVGVVIVIVKKIRGWEWTQDSLI